MTEPADRPQIAVVGAADVTALSSVGVVMSVVEDALERPDLVIIDGARPDLGALCRRIRERSDENWFPILVVGADAEGIVALEAGADSVVAPNAAPAELIARALALLRLKARHDELEARAAQFTDWTRTLVTQVAEQVEQLQRAERLRRFLSPQVADVVAGDERLLESHRREIAVVFCDLRGFTSFSETAEPEEVMSVLRQYHAVLGALVFRFEATLERFAGDAILAFFNDPVPCPDPAGRAVRMAAAMREQVRDLTHGWRRRGHALDFGVGIAFGHATLGSIGFEGRLDYGAVGSVVNLAARLCAEALGGQILVSERTYALIEDAVDAEPVPGLLLKGFHRPVTAFNVVGLRPEVDRAPAPGAVPSQPSPT